MHIATLVRRALAEVCAVLVFLVIIFISFFQGNAPNFQQKGAVTVERIAILSTTRMRANANVMVALPNIGGALSSKPQSLARAHCLTAVQ